MRVQVDQRAARERRDRRYQQRTTRSPPADAVIARDAVVEMKCAEFGAGGHVPMKEINAADVAQMRNRPQAGELLPIGRNGKARPVAARTEGADHFAGGGGVDAWFGLGIADLLPILRMDGRYEPLAARRDVHDRIKFVTDFEDLLALRRIPGHEPAAVCVDFLARRRVV